MIVVLVLINYSLTFRRGLVVYVEQIQPLLPQLGNILLIQRLGLSPHDHTRPDKVRQVVVFISCGRGRGRSG